ncbi:DUF3915 domain-containing protein [Bacillus thuringiensis]|uniref:DUF3915 domain-containing protein n=3 Tax=Bacillus cereus group TaxID=86661 RepID=A0A9X6WNK0_BACTU|nr:DUF3915 domain-containing protein [Bacillus thuringiensis]PEB59930.1 DUF3915 domain-containing protein [Bacillus cereus]PEB66340.1 DUF3915 domain-containing protein [Bacillus thuringiensis]PEB84044.1 DUF3915 domain-containing protein [Bacillus thuringiensis]PEQ53984.1 DUF3915 domain-containing protein [Bacillus thuringiensis]
MRIMFGSFGCCDNFRDCHHHEREHNHREKERVEIRPQRPAVCNVLANLSIGTEVSLLKLKGNGTFRNLVFEGFCNGIALFSALRRDNDKDNNKDDKNGNNRNDDRFEGILRVCPEDVIAIAL